MPDGDVALLPRAVTDLPTEAPQPTSPTQQARVGPFSGHPGLLHPPSRRFWTTAKKLATLDDFSYDPSPTYDIRSNSLMDQALGGQTDRQVFGPNRVVI